MTRDDWKHFDRIKSNPDVRLAMRARCEEQGHHYVGAIGPDFGMLTGGVYLVCEWCGERK